MGKDFLDKAPEAQATKTKTWGYITLTTFCRAKKTHNKEKRQPTEWEKTVVTIHLIKD